MEGRRLISIHSHVCKVTTKTQRMVQFPSPKKKTHSRKKNAKKKKKSLWKWIKSLFKSLTKQKVKELSLKIMSSSTWKASKANKTF